MEAQHLTATAARNDFSGTINRVAYGHERLVIDRHRDAVAVIPAEDLLLLERLEREEEDRIDAAEATRIMEDPDEERIPWEQVKEELDL